MKVQQIGIYRYTQTSMFKIYLFMKREESQVVDLRAEFSDKEQNDGKREENNESIGDPVAWCHTDTNGWLNRRGGVDVGR